MAQWELNSSEEAVIEYLRRLDKHECFKLTIYGSNRNGKRILDIEPSYRVRFQSRTPLSKSIED